MLVAARFMLPQRAQEVGGGSMANFDTLGTPSRARCIDNICQILNLNIGSEVGRIGD